MSDNYEALSFCGIFCGNCGNYKKNMNCKGCRKEPEMLSDCPTRICAIDRKLTHCGECADFPCKVLDGFYHDGSRLHLSAYKNMQEIIEIGVDTWLASRKDNT